MQEEVKIQKLQRKVDALKRETREKVLTEEEKELFRPGTLPVMFSTLLCPRKRPQL